MKLHSAVFYTNTFDEIVAFYRDKLKFSVAYVQEDRYVAFDFENGVRLGIKKAKEEREVPGSQTIFIEVEDVEKLYETLKTEDGLHFLHELVDQDWAKKFAILDPDGNKVEFIEPKM